MLTLVKSTDRRDIESSKPKVLIVDDELPVLLVLKRRLNQLYDISVALNARSALEMPEANGPFSVVITDMHMPGGNGLDFLSEVRTISPDTSRIMLTGDLDRETTLNAVNRGGVLSFLEKPCPAESIAAAIAHGVEVHQGIRQAEAEANIRISDFQNEFRGPLLHIMDFARMIRDGVVSTSTAQEYARQIVNTGEDLLRTSETVLELMSMQHGKTRIEPKPVEIGLLARTAIKPEMNLALAKSVDIRLETAAYPFSAILDSRMVCRALTCLLSNAVRLSPIEAQVVVSAKPVGEDENFVSFEVRDAGEGFPVDILKRFHERNLNPGESLNTFGTGLPYAWNVANLHNGYLELQNTENGALVRLVLPTYRSKTDVRVGPVAP